MPRYKRQFRNGGPDPFRNSLGRFSLPFSTVPEGTKPLSKVGQYSTKHGRSISSRGTYKANSNNPVASKIKDTFKKGAGKARGTTGSGVLQQRSTPRGLSQGWGRGQTPVKPSAGIGTALGRIGGGASSILLTPETLGAPGIDHSYLEGIDLNTFEALDANDFQEPSMPVGHGVLLHDGMINDDVPVGSRSTTPTQTRTTNEPADVFQRQDMASLPEGFGETLTEGIESDPAERFLTGSNSDSVGTPDTPQEGGNFGATALQFLPEAIDFATGVFGKDDVRPATTVNKGALSNFPNKVNVNPQLEAVSRQFRSIVSDPSASMNQKLAALSQTNQAVSQIHGQKTARENQLAANKASIEARLDSQQAQYNERHRQEKMRADANYGVTGNFARQAVANAAGKGLMMKAEKGQAKRDDIALAAVTAGLSDAARNKLFEILEGAK